jgi:hypothetical protein
MKVLGTELVEFFRDGLPEGYYTSDDGIAFEDSYLEVSFCSLNMGPPKIVDFHDSDRGPFPLTDTYDLRLFGKIHSSNAADHGKELPTLQELFLEWKRHRKVTIVFPADREVELLAYLSGIGGKVIG